MTISEASTLPTSDLSLLTLRHNGQSFFEPNAIDANDRTRSLLSTFLVFTEKSVMLIGIPGAFTPVCSSSHLPQFLKNFKAIVDAHVDTIACIAENDAYVMEAFRKDLQSKFPYYIHNKHLFLFFSDLPADNLLMLSDGNGKFAKATGLTVDMNAKGLGERLQRFAMLVRNGQVLYLGSDGEGAEVRKSSAERVLERLALEQARVIA